MSCVNENVILNDWSDAKHQSSTLYPSYFHDNSNTLWQQYPNDLSNIDLYKNYELSDNYNTNSEWYNKEYNGWRWNTQVIHTYNPLNSSSVLGQIDSLNYMIIPDSSLSLFYPIVTVAGYVIDNDKFEINYKRGNGFQL